MKKDIIYFFLIFFVFSIRSVFADNTVSVTYQNSIYTVTGKNYGVEIGKTLANAYGYPRNLYIDDLDFPLNIGGDIRLMIFSNSSYYQAGYTDLADHPMVTQTVESGLSRVILHYENKTSNVCVGGDATSPEKVCINFTIDYYLYPSKYFVVYNVSGNFTGVKFWTTSFRVFFINRISSTLPNNFTYYGMVENLQGSLTTSGYVFPSGTYTFPSSVGFNNSYLFVWNMSHNKTAATAGTFSGFTINNPYLQVRNSGNYTVIEISNSTPAFYNTTNVSFGWVNWFGNSGGGGLEKNHTVNDELNKTYLDFHYPANINIINGTYQNFSKITGTYNFTAINNRVRFNFTLGNYNRTYPVFHVKNISNVTAAKNYAWWKNYTQSNTWVQLTNYTDFVIQEGNRTYFGYDYILLMLNYTLINSSQTYEIWISNSSDPLDEIPPKWSNNLTNNTLAGKPTLFSVNWTDNIGLSGYIFETNNTGLLINDSFVNFENATGNAKFIDSYEFASFPGTWTGTTTSGGGASLTLDTTQKYHGTNSSKHYIPAGTAMRYAEPYKDLATTYTELYARAYFRFNEFPTTTGQEIAIMGLSTTGWSKSGMVAIKKVASGNAVVGIYYYSGTTWTNTYGSTEITTGTWYSIEMRVKLSSTAGIETVWLNGVQEINVENLDNDYYVNMRRVFPTLYTGDLTANSTDAHTAWSDRVVVSTSYIGSATGWSNVTKTLNSTENAVVQWRVYANDTSNNWNASDIFTLTTSAITITLESSKMTSNRQIISRPNSDIQITGRAFYAGEVAYANQQLTFTYDTRSLGSNTTNATGYYWFTFSIPYEGSYNLTVKAQDSYNNTGENTTSLFISVSPIKVKFNFAYHLGISKANDNFTIYKNSLADSWSNVVNTTKKYLCSYESNLLSLIHSGKDSYFYSSVLNQSYSTSDYLFALTNDIENSQLLLAFTKGTCSVIEDKMYLVESYSIPSKALSSFSFGIPSEYLLEIIAKYDKIQINGTDRFATGSHQVCIRKSSISDANKPIVDVRKC